MNDFSEEILPLSDEKLQVFEAFEENSLTDIIRNLQGLALEEAQHILQTLDSHCSMSVLLTNEVMNVGKEKTLAECLKKGLSYFK